LDETKVSASLLRWWLKAKKNGCSCLWEKGGLERRTRERKSEEEVLT
jgi:hypothetical protein